MHAILSSSVVSILCCVLYNEVCCCANGSCKTDNGTLPVQKYSNITKGKETSGEKERGDEPIPYYYDTKETTPDVLWLPPEDNQLPPFVLTKRRAIIDGKEFVFRIFYGEIAKEGEYPYQLSLRSKRKEFYISFCGAATIKPDMLISAAHCFVSVDDDRKFHNDMGFLNEKDLDYISVVGGTTIAVSHYHGKKDTQKYGQWRKLVAVLFPKEYRFPYKDVCIGYLKTGFSYNHLVQPIKIATVSTEYTGQSCKASGYGMREKGQRSAHLRKALLLILSTEVCNKIHYRDMKKYVCTSDKISDAGRGDSGGPFVCQNTNDPNENPLGVLIGVVCGGKAGVNDGNYYTRLTSYKEFLKVAIEDTQKSDLSSSSFVAVCDKIIVVFVVLVNLM